jgi:hypothetical protein
VRSDRSRRRAAVVATVALALLVGGIAPAALASASPYPPLPISDDRGFLANLSAPTLAPGASGAVSFSIGDPLSDGLEGADLTFQVYAFNGFPGNATTLAPVPGAPVLSNATASGASVGVSVGNLASGASFHGSVGIATSAATPNGAFAVRTALSFVAGGVSYLLESRGWFTAAQWSAATELPNGSATLNLTALGVSGVTPETAIVVANSSLPWVLGGVLAAAFVLVGIGAWIYFRRESSSSSGTRRAADDHQAPRAFGTRRTSDGD